MAKNRFINTKFWSDNFVVELNPLDRYLFLYFLTNEHTNICGIYELPLKRMSDETGIEKEMLLKMLKRLKGKVEYVDGWIYIKNFIKHQSPSEKVLIGIENSKKLIPSHILEKIYLMDKVSIPTDISESELKLKLKLESESEDTEQSSVNSGEVIYLFKEINPSYELLYKRKPQHESAKRLLKREGLERIKNAIQFLLIRKSDKYCPQISTPIQLEEKWASLEKYGAGLKNDLSIKNKPTWKIWN